MDWLRWTTDPQYFVFLNPSLTPRGFGAVGRRKSVEGVARGAVPAPVVVLAVGPPARGRGRRAADAGWLWFYAAAASFMQNPSIHYPSGGHLNLSGAGATGPRRVARGLPPGMPPGATQFTGCHGGLLRRYAAVVAGQTFCVDDGVYGYRVGVYVCLRPHSPRASGGYEPATAEPRGK